MTPGRSRPGPGPGLAGLTLLELVVALTIMVAAMTLVGALWSQMRDWAADNGRLTEGLQPRRVAAFLRRQWEEQRSIVPVDDKGKGSVTVDQDTLRFVTALPALFPDAPLVVASWTIERTPDVRTPEWWPARLVYEEARVTNMKGVGPDTYDSRGQLARRRIVALDGCRDLRWEVWSGAGAPPPAAEGETPLGGMWRRVDAPTLVALAAAQDPQQDGKAKEPGAAPPAPTAPDRPIASGVVGFGEAEAVKQGSPPALRAIRIAGVAGAEEFSWSFVVEASR